MQITKIHIEAAKGIIEGKLTYKEIAEGLKVSQQSICNWLKKEEFQKLMDELADAEVSKAKKILRRWSPEATKKLIMLLKSNDDEVARKSANDILKGAGIISVSEKVADDSGRSNTIQIINNIPGGILDSRNGSPEFKSETNRFSVN